MFTVKLNSIHFLLPFHALFLFIAIISVNSRSSILMYMNAVAFSSMIPVYVLLVKKSFYRITFRWQDVIPALIFLAMASIILLCRRDYFVFVLIVSAISTMALFKEAPVKLSEFVGFVNVAYLTYFAFSVLAYFGVIPVSEEFRNNMDMVIGNLAFVTFTGVEGSTAHIDSFSAIVFQMNLIFYSNKKNIIVAGVSLFALLWTARFTPWVVVAGTVAALVLVKNRVLAFLFILFMFASYFGTICLLYAFPDYYMFGGLTLRQFLQLGTSSRSEIWLGLVGNVLNEFSIGDILFGNQKLMEVSIGWGKGFTSNPHSSYLHMFFRGGIILPMALIWYCPQLLRGYDRKGFAIVCAVLISAMVNNIIFYPANLIYLIIFIYFSQFYRPQRLSI